MEGPTALGEGNITAGVSQPGSVEVGPGGLWTPEGVMQGRNGLGRLGLASQTQVDMGVREGGFLQIQLSPMSRLCSEWGGKSGAGRFSG